MSVQSNIKEVKKYLPANVQLVCVSKFHPVESIMEAYTAGERIFGESKVQEMCEKYESLPKDIEWHFIGHLQTNKIKYIVPFVSLVHGVDSFRLLAEIDKQAGKINRKIHCLLQVHIAREETKFGFSGDELIELMKGGECQKLQHISIRGLMGMATYTDIQEQVKSEFRQLKSLFDVIKKDYFNKNESFNILSMGMSDDYRIAVDEGSTMIRVGSRIFGQRN